MVTKEHKYWLARKKLFVDGLSKALAYDCGQVIDLRYEAYEKEDETEPLEFVIVTFRGGAISVRNVHMNSHSAILRDVGQLVDGGYYAEVEYYEKLQSDKEWSLIDFSKLCK